MRSVKCVCDRLRASLIGMHTVEMTKMQGKAFIQFGKMHGRNELYISLQRQRGAEIFMIDGLE